MVGGFVMTQKDIQTELTKPDAIGMGSYNSDSHNVQRYVTPEGTAQNEGYNKDESCHFDNRGRGSDFYIIDLRRSSLLFVKGGE